MDDQTNYTEERINQLKGLSLLNNVHNVAPLPSRQNDDQQSVAIVEAIRSYQFIVKSFLELQGMRLDPFTNKWIPFRTPVMNELGIGNFIAVCENIVENFEFSYIPEAMISPLAVDYFKKNISNFFIYHEDFELQRHDFNIIKSKLQTFILAALYKGRHGGHRNTVRGTYSEDMLSKLLPPSQLQGQRKPSVLSRINPFGRREQ